MGCSSKRWAWYPMVQQREVESTRIPSAMNSSRELKRFFQGLDTSIPDSDAISSLAERAISRGGCKRVSRLACSARSVSRISRIFLREVRCFCFQVRELFVQGMQPRCQGLVPHGCCTRHLVEQLLDGTIQCVPHFRGYALNFLLDFLHKRSSRCGHRG